MSFHEDLGLTIKQIALLQFCLVEWTHVPSDYVLGSTT